jgi:chromate transport protein ChrA
MEDDKPTIREQAREKTVGFVTAALGFVAGLAWNDAVQALIHKYIKLDQNSVWAQLLYAVGITVVAVVLIVYLERFSKNRE